MGWLKLAGSLKLYVTFAKEPCRKDYILQKRPIILRSLLIEATPYPTVQFDLTECTHTRRVKKRRITCAIPAGVVMWDGTRLLKFLSIRRIDSWCAKRATLLKILSAALITSSLRFLHICRVESWWWNCVVKWNKLQHTAVHTLSRLQCV